MLCAFLLIVAAGGGGSAAAAAAAAATVDTVVATASAAVAAVINIVVVAFIVISLCCFFSFVLLVPFSPFWFVLPPPFPASLPFFFVRDDDASLFICITNLCRFCVSVVQFTDCSKLEMIDLCLVLTAVYHARYSRIPAAITFDNVSQQGDRRFPRDRSGLLSWGPTNWV